MPYRFTGIAGYGTRRIVDENYEQILNLFGSSIIAYWPLNDTIGTVAKDSSINNRHGLYVGTPALANVAAPRNINTLTFDASNDKVNIYSAALAAAFNGAEGSLMLWIKIGAAEWADSTQRNMFYLSADASNRVELYKSTNANQIAMSYRAGGVAKALTVNNISHTDWWSYQVTWSKSNDRLFFYINGTQINTPITGLGTFAGALASTATNIGSITTAQLFKGSIAHVVLLNREATPAEVKAYATISVHKKITVLGDSISAMGDITWPFKLPFQYSYGSIPLTVRGVTGASISSGLAAQVTAAASDNASHIIIAMGTNDDNAGNMTTLQATAEAQIAALKVSNPGAQLYWLNVLPRWTNNTGATPVDKANIRTAIEAACTAQSITCWDTLTDPWITAAQTSDGLHPINAGMDAIVTQVKARI